MKEVPLGRNLQVGLFCALVFGFFLFQYTTDNRFPFFYHPDEPDKVDQVITGKWNFHHPLLMLGTAEIAKKTFAVPDREESVVIMGRWLSAVFAAMGVTTFALLGWRMRGLCGGLVALVLGFQHQVFELAHYFKEDTSLLCAMGFAFLALHFYWRRGSGAAAALAGAACGLCLSAKYLGAVMLVPAMVLLWRSKNPRPARWPFFSPVSSQPPWPSNWPILLQLDLFQHSLGRETQLVEHGEKAYSGQVPIFEYLRIFVHKHESGHLASARRRTGRPLARAPGAGCLRLGDAGFPLRLYAAALLFHQDERPLLPPRHRRLLLTSPPSEPSICRGSSNSTGPGPRRLLPPRSSCASLAAIHSTLPLHGGLPARRPRANSPAWIKGNVPAAAVIAGEDHADLPVPRRQERLQVQPLLPQKVIETKYAAESRRDPR